MNKIEEEKELEKEMTDIEETIREIKKIAGNDNISVRGMRVEKVTLPRFLMHKAAYELGTMCVGLGYAAPFLRSVGIDLLTGVALIVGGKIIHHLTGEVASGTGVTVRRIR